MDKEKADAIRLANAIIAEPYRYPDPLIGDLSVLARQFLRALERQNWQPISSAPKDGTDILLWCNQPVCARWDRTGDADEGEWWMDCTWPGMSAPTHWLPIDPPGKEG